MKIGKLTAPTSRSAYAILMTKKRLFLRMFLFITKRTIVRMFPETTKTKVTIKAVLQAIPSALKWPFIDKFGWLLFIWKLPREILFILKFYVKIIVWYWESKESNAVVDGSGWIHGGPVMHNLLITANVFLISRKLINLAWPLTEIAFKLKLRAYLYVKSF